MAEPLATPEGGKPTGSDEVLNRYLTLISGAIQDHGETLDRFNETLRSEGIG